MEDASKRCNPIRTFLMGRALPSDCDLGRKLYESVLTNIRQEELCMLGISDSEP